MFKVVGYLKARFNERSTYGAIVAAIGIAAALQAPWSYLSVAVGVIGVLVPTSGKAPE